MTRDVGRTSGVLPDLLSQHVSPLDKSASDEVTNLLMQVIILCLIKAIIKELLIELNDIIMISTDKPLVKLRRICSTNSAHF